MKMTTTRPPWLDTIDADVREEILDTSAKLLARRATPAEIGKALGTQFRVPAGDGDEARAAVLAAGLARLVGWVGVPREDPRFDSLALCESIVRSNASVRERMAAQQRIDELRDLGDPLSPAAGAAYAEDGGGLLVGMSDEQLEQQILRLRSEAGEAAG